MKNSLQRSVCAGIDLRALEGSVFGSFSGPVVPGYRSLEYVAKKKDGAFKILMRLVAKSLEYVRYVHRFNKVFGCTCSTERVDMFCERCQSMRYKLACLLADLLQRLDYRCLRRRPPIDVFAFKLSLSFLRTVQV